MRRLWRGVRRAARQEFDFPLVKIPRILSGVFLRGWCVRRPGLWRPTHRDEPAMSGAQIHLLGFRFRGFTFSELFASGGAFFGPVFYWAQLQVFQALLDFGLVAYFDYEQVFGVDVLGGGGNCVG